MKQKKHLPFRYAILALGFFILTAAMSGPPMPFADGGGFPTATPTYTPVPPTHAPTNAPEATTTTTPLPEVNGPNSAAIPDFMVPTSTPTQAPESSTGNPLMPLVYIGLFILLVVGIYFLFSRRGMLP